MELLHSFFSDDGFMPDGHCYLWNPGVARLRVISDLLISVAYFSIPFALDRLRPAQKRSSVELMFVCFRTFNGFELLKEIRKRQCIDAIVLSGFGMKDDLRRSREAGFADYLIKPINLDRLQAAIRRIASQLN
jgi:CheY-like chemotaxis protein